MIKVFISYSSTDIDWVERFVKDLTDFGLSTWLDRKDILAGEEIVSKIEQGIRECNVFCLVLSQSSVERSWVRREYVTAIHMQLSKGFIRIIPAKIQDCEIPEFLLDINYADFSANYHAGLEAFCRALGIDISRPFPYCRTFKLIRDSPFGEKTLRGMLEKDDDDLYRHKMWILLRSIERSIRESVEQTLSEIGDCSPDKLQIMITPRINFMSYPNHDVILDCCFPVYHDIEGLSTFLHVLSDNYERVSQRQTYILPESMHIDHLYYPDGGEDITLDVLGRLRNIPTFAKNQESAFLKEIKDWH